MNLRYSITQQGEIHLEQLLQTIPLNGDQIIRKWERVPMVGSSSNESWSLPMSVNCGYFFFENIVQKYYVDEETKSRRVDIVSALSINNVSEHENNKTRINVDKNFYIINLPLFELLPILTRMLSGHEIINVDLNGEIIKEKEIL